VVVAITADTTKVAWVALEVSNIMEETWVVLVTSKVDWAAVPVDITVEAGSAWFLVDNRAASQATWAEVLVSMAAVAREVTMVEAGWVEGLTARKDGRSICVW
jgi:hypothetical protein